jgi:hypothetical protein
VNVDIENKQAPIIGDIIAYPVHNGVLGDVVDPDTQQANASDRAWDSVRGSERKGGGRRLHGAPTLSTLGCSEHGVRGVNPLRGIVATKGEERGLTATPSSPAREPRAGSGRPNPETGGAVANPPTLFETLAEAERAAGHAARTDPTARLCGGVGIAQEVSSGLYRLVTTPRDQSPARGEASVSPFGQEERLVAYVGCEDV